MKRLLLVLAVVLLAGCSAQAPVATRTPGLFFVGASAGSASGFSAATGVRPNVVEHYIQPSSAFSPGFAGAAIPLIEIMPFSVSLKSFTGGQEDGWLRTYARAVAAYRKPVILGFAPEMNGYWYSWDSRYVTPAAYIAAWRHVVKVFRTAGALNVKWLWTVNVETFGSGSTPHVGSPVPWWPGASWVTWIGIDGYYYLPTQDYTDVFADTLASIRPLGKPVLIAETGVAPAAGKSSKIPGLFAGAKSDGLIGLVWFDLRAKRDWRLDDDPAAIAAFQKAVKEYRG